MLGPLQMVADTCECPGTPGCEWSVMVGQRRVVP